MCLAVPGRILEIYESNGLLMGKIDFDGVMYEACLTFVPEAIVGDYAIIHAGFALSLINEIEAMATLTLLKDIANQEPVE